MSYDHRVANTLRSPSESALIALIQEEIQPEDVNIKSKEKAINALAQFYVDHKTPEKIKSIAEK